jgi:predicted component of type VI protein secretion system
MPMPLKLTVYKGSDLALEQVFERDIIKIGRLASAHLKLEDAKVSRIHAVIESSGGGAEYSIIDMGSTEGTFLNGEKVSKEKLSDGDELRLGDCRILVSFDGVSTGVAAQSIVTSHQGKPSIGELWAASQSELQAAEPTMTISPMPIDSMVSMMSQPPPPPPMQPILQAPVSHMQVQQPMSGYRQDPWGSVPNNLASDGVGDGDRALEIKAL